MAGQKPKNDIGKLGFEEAIKELTDIVGKIEQGEIDPSFVITHKMALEDAPQAYAMFRNKEDECIKVVLKP